jgi:hypothetical protein
MEKKGFGWVTINHPSIFFLKHKKKSVVDRVNVKKTAQTNLGPIFDWD